MDSQWLDSESEEGDPKLGDAAVALTAYRLCKKNTKKGKMLNGKLFLFNCYETQQVETQVTSVEQGNQEVWGIGPDN